MYLLTRFPSTFPWLLQVELERRKLELKQIGNRILSASGDTRKPASSPSRGGPPPPAKHTLATGNRRPAPRDGAAAAPSSKRMRFMADGGGSKPASKPDMPAPPMRSR